MALHIRANAGRDSNVANVVLHIVHLSSEFPLTWIVIINDVDDAANDVGIDCRVQEEANDGKCHF